MATQQTYVAPVASEEMKVFHVLKFPLLGGRAYMLRTQPPGTSLTPRSWPGLNYLRPSSPLDLQTLGFSLSLSLLCLKDEGAAIYSSQVLSPALPVVWASALPQTHRQGFHISAKGSGRFFLLRGFMQHPIASKRQVHTMWPTPEARWLPSEQEPQEGQAAVFQCFTLSLSYISLYFAHHSCLRSIARPK